MCNRFCTELDRRRRKRRQAVDKYSTEAADRQYRQLNFDQYQNNDYYSAIDYGDDPLTAASDQLGSYSGHHKCDNGISICLLVTTLAGIAILYFILFTRITMAGRRRKKRGSSASYDDAWLPLRMFDSDSVVDFIVNGT